MHLQKHVHSCPDVEQFITLWQLSSGLNNQPLCPWRAFLKSPLTLTLASSSPYSNAVQMQCDLGQTVTWVRKICHDQEAQRNIWSTTLYFAQAPAAVGMPELRKMCATVSGNT